MRILFLTLYPFENLTDGYIAADLACELIKKNINLTVITPTLNVKERKSKIIIKDDYKHIYIASGPIQKVNPIKKALGLFKLDLLTIKYLKLEKQYDLIITMVSHCAFYSAVKYLKKRDNCIIYNLVKDIFPDNVVDLKLLKNNSIIYKKLKRKEQRYYKISDYLGVLSPANKNYLLAHNPFLIKEKVEINPNSIIPRDLLISDQEKKDIMRNFNIPNDKVILLYGGNLGIPQGIDFLLDCMLENEKQESGFFLIIGDGTEYEKIESFINKYKLKNSALYHSVKQDLFRKITSIADIGLVFLNKNFTVPNFPSRMLSYMEVRKPILFAVDSATDCGIIAEENNFGFNCLNGDLDCFFNVLKKLINNNILRNDYGNNAYNYLCKEFTAKKSVEIILSHLEM